MCSPFSSSFITFLHGLAIRASDTTYHLGIPEALSGTFDGTELVVDGHPGYGILDGHYSFHIEAAQVLVPPGLVLFASGFVIVFMLRKRYRS